MMSTNYLDIEYPVMEHFYTLQGEGHYTGQAAYFIRLAGCDVGCVWCDVKESWDAAIHPKLKVSKLLKAASAHPCKIVVITGGEPTLHQLDALTTVFQEAGFKTHLETAATNPISGKWDWITLSPKKFKAPLLENLKLAHELKVIIFHKSDFEWAEKHAKHVSPSCLLYLQPEWGKVDSITPLVIDYIKDFPNWQLSLQTHKYIHIP